MAGGRANLLLIVADSLRADHMSLYGYGRLTTPNIGAFARGGAVFETAFSPHIPTTPAFAGLLTGRDCFGTGVVSLRHNGPMRAGTQTLPELLRTEGYESSCVGFSADEPAVRGFDHCLDYAAWGAWAGGRCRKAENLAAVALPELRRLAGGRKSFCMLLRYMDPHAPSLPPPPFERMFYGGNEFDPTNKSMEPIFAFKPMRDFQASWMPPGLTDKDYVIAQYDGAVAYMDACIGALLTEVSALGLDESTLIVLIADHGETLYEHDCHFDHHGLYECTLRIPLIFRMPGKLPAGRRVDGMVTLQDMMPTILELLGVAVGCQFDGRSLVGSMRNGSAVSRRGLYITEATWMRKHGWRTREWKVIRALEPDFHFKPEVELYNLIEDPGENVNLASAQPDVVKLLQGNLDDWIAKREGESGRRNPLFTETRWHGCPGVDGPFTTSQQAYDTLHIGPVQTEKTLRSRREVLEALGYV
jgi:arylsulfatase A-like enzyme